MKNLRLIACLVLTAIAVTGCRVVSTGHYADTYYDGQGCAYYIVREVPNDGRTQSSRSRMGDTPRRNQWVGDYAYEATIRRLYSADRGTCSLKRVDLP